MSSGSEKHPLHEHALRQLIRVALDKSYYREYLHHPDRDISHDDVIHGLERSDWTLEGNPEWNNGNRTYRYKICTVDIEGDELKLIISAYPDEKRIEIITAW
jgi:hypothetical protein